ncbi:glycosyltransferase [Blastococcus mobilis]|uniref:Glycosyl transferase family 2 n=1 Tax=Blastococcus mobilis TaxID=1938746 RepID=A0A238ZZI3_9ACTN|nr:glycosyltransferase [Blastococcus mobilis]SNR88562.1 Glycosyl transferase family 2 [Blastococcus mobilis]
MGRLLDGEYVLPLRWTDDAGLDDLTDYLRRISAWLPVTVVDGSPAERFDAHARAWAGLVRHLRPLPWPGANGKVAGVVTGVRAARRERVVVADDDVRYDRDGLERVLDLLGAADVVRPQNVFRPAPWHARWDTGRTLLNRAVSADYPGTFALRRATFLAMGGYRGDVLFENLEMVRTVRAVGGREHRANDLFVERRPPTAAHFWSQRPRQAYDDLAQPWRLVAALAVWPVVLDGLVRRRGRRLALLAAAVVAAGETGRRRHGGRGVFPAGAALWSPVWVLERGLFSWLALGARFLRGGVAYGDVRLRTAASSMRRLRREAAGRSPLARIEASGAERPHQASGSSSP